MLPRLSLIEGLFLVFFSLYHESLCLKREMSPECVYVCFFAFDVFM